jgi:tetratricopeptide (TPR) repeat protein
MARARAQTPAPPQPDPVEQSWGIRFTDAPILSVFLSLAFLLGVFPLNDTDFWWHLRTGDLIRQTGEVPTFDTYLYGGDPQKPWVDLHWGFEVLLSLGYERGGVVLLNLAKCVISTLAVFLLITARRRDWPIWSMVLAWLPALLLLGGRMYVRPETLTLLYLAAFLAVIFRWKERPRLAFALPAVQVLWVNSQGLFVFGPVLIVLGLVDAVLTPGFLEPSRRGWWKTVLLASALTGVACLLNPYGLTGTLFPLHLLGTMGNPIFENIGELMPLPKFIADVGLGNFPLQLHLSTMLLGGLSFVIPLSWKAATRLADANARRASAPEESPREGKSGRRKNAPKKGRAAEPVIESWNLSPFRFLLYLIFSALSWKATRNSHQFAAVVGTVTAWNFGEWAAALRRRRIAKGWTPTARSVVAPRVAALVVVTLVFASVASGAFYAIMGEGRTIGLGEKTLWYPRGAVLAAGRPGMPEKFVCFHNGHAALFEYYHGPDRKVFADARLEVVGQDLYRQYINLERMIAANESGWRQHLAAQGNPGVLVDLVQSGSGTMAATLFADRDWVCVYFDAVAAVFVHKSYPAASQPVDFVSRHFEPDSAPRDEPELVATARVLHDVSSTLQGPDRNRSDLTPGLLLLGHGDAHLAIELDPNSAGAWKRLGQIETLRIPVPPEVLAKRPQAPFDPLLDLAIVRATYDLVHADRLAPDDFATLLSLSMLYTSRNLLDVVEPVLERLGSLKTINALQRTLQDERNLQGIPQQLGQIRKTLGPPPASDWRNLGELERAVGDLHRRGRVKAAADLLESAYKPQERTWELTDRMATLRLHLGEPERARALWESAAVVPRPALQAARVAVTHLVQEDYEAARRFYNEALRAEPQLFEALYGLATLEADAGRRTPAVEAARAAEAAAPSDLARSAAQRLLRLIDRGGSSPPPAEATRSAPAAP